MHRGRGWWPARRYAGLVCLSVLAALTVVGWRGKALAAGPKQGGTLTVGVDREFRGFDPLTVIYLQKGDRSVVMAIEERLFDLDDKGRLVPELALSATPSEDGKAWTIKLRQGVSFHDGTPFNADAVVVHWERMLNPRNRFSGAIYIEPVQSVTKIDEHTVRFILKHPWAALTSMLSGAQLTGAYIPSPKAVREKTQNRAPVGTGPFMFKEWVASDRLVVVRNPGYWRKGKPYLDSVVFRPVPDMQSLFAGLRSGATDLIQTDWAPHILDAIKGRSLKVYSADSSGPYTFIINTENPPLDDVRVRRALAYAWNQESYLRADSRRTLPMAKEPFGGTLSCGDYGYRSYNPAKAKKLLAEYGKPVTLELLVPDTPRGKESGKSMQRLFREAGITLKLALATEGELVRKVMRGNYQIADWRLTDLNDMGPYLRVCLHSKGQLNFSRYRNPAMDELLETQLMSTDDETRQKALCQIATRINEDVMYLYGGGRRFHVIANPSIQGVDMIEHGVIRVSEIWVKEEVKKAKKKSKKVK